MWDADFKLGKWLNGIKTDIISEDQDKNFFAEIIVYVTVAAAALVCLSIAIILRKFGSQSLRQKMAQKLMQLKAKMVWNGLVNSLVLSHFKYCVAIGTQIRLYIVSSPY